MNAYEAVEIFNRTGEYPNILLEDDFFESVGAITGMEFHSIDDKVEFLKVYLTEWVLND